MWRKPESGTKNLAKSSHIPILDHLRGIAALSVCFFHFTCCNGYDALIPENDPVRQLGSYGWLGVEAFFVISGFVIPYSLHHRCYRWRDAPEFIIRRLKRLEPPYFACVLIHLVLKSGGSLFSGANELSVGQVLAHLGYLNALLGYEWLNPAFWTLAIEFQFYFFMALIFPLINANRLATRLLSVLSLASLPFFVPSDVSLLPYWLPLFALVILTYQLLVGRISLPIFCLMFVCIAIMGFKAVGWKQTVAAGLTAVTIATLRARTVCPRFAWLSWTGKISYSLYLMHAASGGVVFKLAAHWHYGTEFRYVVLLLAFVSAIVVSYWFWRIVELPAHRWAAGTGIRDSRPSDPGVTVVQQDMSTVVPREF